MKKVILFILLTVFSGLLAGCNSSPSQSTTTGSPITSASTSQPISSTETTTVPISYFDDEYINPLKDNNVGGVDSLYLNIEDKTATMENEYIRIIFNMSNGSIKEICNKIAKVYLTQNNLYSFGIKIQKIDKELIAFRNFTLQAINDDSDMKKIRLTWEFENNLMAIVEASLAESSHEVLFSLKLQNNQADDSVISVEYPTIDNIGSLYKPEQDMFLSPLATGYLFQNPTENFNLSNFNGITKDFGKYPSGWEYPMQMMAYYSQGIGGFALWTKDSGTTIKSFAFTGAGHGKLRTGIYHYLDNSADENVDFAYDISISCLDEGVWEEAAEIYRSWSLTQPWAQKGALNTRSDIDIDLFEKTGLVNFGIPGQASLYWPDLPQIYETIHNSVNAEIFNIFLNSWQRIHISNEFNSDWDSYFPANLNYNFITQINDYGDSFVLFEFNTLYNKNYYRVILDGWADRAIEMINDQKALFTWSSGSDFREWYFICPSCPEWVAFSLEKDQEILEYGSSGLYHDVGTAAVAPMQCYDSSHPHGARVNIIPDYIELERLSKQLALDNGYYSVGQELIYEQLLPYVDFYQARANAGLMSWMEGDRIRVLLENGSASKVPLFDYVYHTLGGLRIDGFMMPLTELGGGYYYTLAKTVLEGGLPEFNFEFLAGTLQYDEIDMDMLSFVGELAQARTTYGKEYLVYGEMARAPKTGAGKIEYSFVNTNVVSGSSFLQGDVVVDKIVTSAFRQGNETAIFLCNITDSPIDTSFVVNAGRDYGIESGEVYLYDELISSFSDGKVYLNLSLEPRKVYMIIIR